METVAKGKNEHIKQNYDNRKIVLLKVDPQAEQKLKKLEQHIFQISEMFRFRLKYRLKLAKKLSYL